MVMLRLMKVIFSRRITRLLTPTLLLLLFSLPSSLVIAQDTAQESASPLQALSEQLSSKKKDIQFQAIDDLAESGHERVGLWLNALLEGQLYKRKSDGLIVIAQKSGKLYATFNADTDEPLEEVKKRSLSKLSINNAIRGKLRGLLSVQALKNPDPSKREAAIAQLVGKVDTDAMASIREMSTTETDEGAKEQLKLLIAVHDLENGDAEQQANALAYADGNMNQPVINALRTLSVSAEDESARNLAAGLVDKADKKLKWYARAETVFFGISLGSVLVVAAIGLAITFGVMGVINMAHGELIMLGAYTTYFIQQLFPNAIEISLLLAIPAAFLVSGFVGILIERGVIRHLYGRPLETLLATFGISLMLQQAVRTFVSSQNVAVINPSWMSGSWAVTPALSLTLNRLVIIGFCVLVFALLLLLFNRSGFGLQMRAVAQNRQMARAMGIRSARVDALTFGLGSGIAGIAGVALSQLGNVGPNLGQNYIIDSFMVVVFGGVGNLWGTLVAGMTLGIANKVAEPWAGAVMAKVLILVFIIVFIQRRPRGLFPQRGRAAEG